MPAKLPFQKWFWADWFRDTRRLSLAAKGFWIDVIGYLKEETRTGSATLSLEQWATLTNGQPQHVSEVLIELTSWHICDIVRTSDGLVTIRCRRIARDKNTRRNATLRQENVRRVRAVTLASQEGDNHIHIQKHIQRQKQRHIHIQKQRQKHPEHTPDSGEQESGKNIPASLSRTRGRTTESLAAPVWEAYANAYATRYGITPVRNARVNSALKQLRERVGLEQSPAVAAFYVTHNDALYVRSRHPTTLLLRDAEGLMTQMRTGQKATRQEAMQAETKDAIRDQVARVSAILGGNHDDQ